MNNIINNNLPDLNAELKSLKKEKTAAIDKEISLYNKNNIQKFINKGKLNIKVTYMQDFVDEDTGEIVSIERTHFIVKNDIFLVKGKKSKIDSKITSIKKQIEKIS